jgi:hypothetical protein
MTQLREPREPSVVASRPGRSFDPLDGIDTALLERSLRRRAFRTMIVEPAVMLVQIARMLAPSRVARRLNGRGSS